MMLASSNALKSSAMYIGYLILKEIKKQEAGKISIYDVSKACLLYTSIWEFCIGGYESGKLLSAFYFVIIGEETNKE